MILTKKQEEGLKIAVERYKNREKYTVISGYAGTGKSTLVRFIIAALKVSEHRVCYATFTGKAAEVLRQMGNKNAQTLHHLLYEHIPKAGGGFIRKRKPRIEYDVVVVDEVSMVPKDIMELLFSHAVYVICLGDPFQIPPIDKETDNHLLDNPHIFLDEIMRQEEGNEIIQLSMGIRQMKAIPPHLGTNVRVYNKRDFIPDMLTWADQVLVATNNKRIELNNTIRKMKGFAFEPQPGDKVVCLRNYWDDISSAGNPLVNGLIGYLGDPETTEIKFPWNARTSIKSIPALISGVSIEDNEYYDDLYIDKSLLLYGQPSLDWRDSYKLNQRKQIWGDLVPKEFGYGYAITGHKAQGSQWDKVLVIEERFPFDKIEHARWLYTCITRAIDKVVLIKAE